MGKKQPGKKHGKAKNTGVDAKSNSHAIPSSRRTSKRIRGKQKIEHADDDYKLRESIETDDNRTIMDMDADGNCLFRALSDQLYRDFGNNHDDIRSDICDYLEAFESDFSCFLVLDENEQDEDAADFETYVYNMRQDGEWGGNLELVAAARLYCREITVFATSMAAFAVGPGDDKKSRGPPLLLSFHENEHYNSVRDSTVGIPPPPIKTFEKVVETDPAVDSEIEKEEVDKEESDKASCAQLLENGDPESESHESTGSQKVPVVKKSAPCPCGSGLRYKKCCWAKEKHAERLRKLRMDESVTEDSPASDDDEVTVGSFRVMQI